MHEDTFEARADRALPSLIEHAMQQPALRNATADQLRRALALRIVADTMPADVFENLPRDLSQQPVPDDVGDAVGLLGIARDVLATPDTCCDASRDIVAVLLVNMAARLEARQAWEHLCRCEAIAALHP